MLVMLSENPSAGGGVDYRWGCLEAGLGAYPALGYNMYLRLSAPDLGLRRPGNGFTCKLLMSS